MTQLEKIIAARQASKVPLPDGGSIELECFGKEPELFIRDGGGSCVVLGESEFRRLADYLNSLFEESESK